MDTHRNNYFTRRRPGRPPKCKVLMDKSLGGATFDGTNGSGLKRIFKHRKFTADGVMLKETAIDNSVIRIPLQRDNLKSIIKDYEFERACKSPTFKKTLKFNKVLQNKSVKNGLKNKSDSFTRSPVKKNPKPEIKPNFEQQKPQPVRNPTTQKIIKKISQEEGKTNYQQRLQSGKQIFREEIKQNRIVMNSFYNDKKERTLNRTIKKKNQKQINAKYFPQKSTDPLQNVKNGNISQAKDKAVAFHNELLLTNDSSLKSPIDSTQLSYYLEFSEPRLPDDGKLNYKFHKLVTDVRHMKLPTPVWKIKVIIRQSKIAAIIFSNKLEPERSVKFSADKDKFEVVIDNQPAFLLGCPGTVDTPDDIEILLDILETIDHENPMIFYK